MQTREQAFSTRWYLYVCVRMCVLVYYSLLLQPIFTTAYFNEAYLYYSLSLLHLIQAPPFVMRPLSVCVS